jgi:hypothetical protein
MGAQDLAAVTDAARFGPPFAAWFRRALPRWRNRAANAHSATRQPSEDLRGIDMAGTRRPPRGSTAELAIRKNSR